MRVFLRAAFWISLLGITALLGLTNDRKQVQQIYIIDDAVYEDLEPGIEMGVWEAIGVLQQALERRAPAWAQYRVKAVKNPVHPLHGSLADEIWGLLLVTAGVALGQG
jgi:hypothetical protein